jgi:nicotinamidase/pyrazinamidase
MSRINPTARINLTPEDALLVIDVQNDFVYGTVAMPEAPGVIPVINRISGRFHRVVFTQDWHPPGHISFASRYPGARPGEWIQAGYGEQLLYPDHCVQGEPGAELASALDLRAATLRLYKGCRRDVDSYSAFTENDRRTDTGLTAYLRSLGIRRVFFAGLSLYGCVRCSALDAVRAGFASFIIVDACRARASPSNQDHAAELTAAGVGRLISDDLI